MKTGNRKLNRFVRGDTALDPTLVTANNKWDFCDEPVFRSKLTKERKRAERSLRPFLLVLVTLKDTFFQAGKNSSAAGCLGLIDTICQKTRDTDIRGWYNRGRVVGVICTEVCPESSKLIIDKIQRQMGNGQYQDCVEICFHLFSEHSNGQTGAGGSCHIPLCFYPNEDYYNKRSYLFAKRTYDILGSILALVIFSPLFGLIALLIKIDSPGSVFFVQERIGIGGQPFKFYKFRTMYQSMDDSIHREYVAKLIGGSVGKQDESDTQGRKKIYKIEDDPRVTPVGKFLRKSSLDELPQFLNVFKGEMSLVGPRPAIPYEFEHYQLWHRRRVMEYKPGITGLWQVEGRSTTTFDSMVRMDLRYCNSCSLIQDIKLLLKTPVTLMGAEGAL